jgi:tetratricopeptide (TPR) repeat protein
LFLFLVIALPAGAFASFFVWSRFYMPAAMLAEARATSARNPREAERQTAEAIAQAGGTFPEAQLFHAQLLTSLGRTDEALGQFSLIKEPGRLPAAALCDLARAAMACGDTLLAREAFAAVRPDSELYLQAQRALIQIHLQAGQEDLARSMCLKLLDREPADVTGWQVLGTVAMNRKDLAEAEKAFRQCLELAKDPTQTREVRADLIQVLIDRGDVPGARRELSTLRDSSDESSERTLLQEAWLLRLEGNPRAGVRVLEPLISQEKQSAIRARLLRGLLYVDLGENEKARADLESVVAAQPWNKEAQHKLGVAYDRLGQREKAAEHYAAAARLVELAKELLDRSLQLTEDPTNRRLRQQVAELHDQLGQPDEARRLLGMTLP